MNKSKCIFKEQRCKKCNNLILKSEKHDDCPFRKTTNKKHLLQKIYNVLKKNPRITASVIAFHVFETIRDSSRTFEVKKALQNNMDLFSCDKTQNYWYITNQNESKIKQPKPKTRYYIAKPYSKNPIVFSLKKLTTASESKKETTLAMIYGYDLAKKTLYYYKEIQA